MNALRWRPWAAALALVATLSGMAQAAITVTDDRGQRFTLEQPPQRIVTLLPSLTESVCALQACGRLVGTDRYSNWPEAVKALPKLGGLDDAQLERIVALKPDLVLAAVSGRVNERLEQLGIRVITFEAKTLADTHRVLEQLAGVLGQPGAGEALWRSLDQRLSAAAQRVPPALRGRKVYFEVAATPYAAGEASFVGEVLARLGMANIVPASMGPFPKLNPEFIVRARPELLMAAARNIAEMPQRPGWASLVALQQRQTCGWVEAEYEPLIRPGPRLAEAADRLADCLVALGKGGPGGSSPAAIAAASAAAKAASGGAAR